MRETRAISLGPETSAPRGLRPFTAMSVVIHVVGTLVLSFVIVPPQKAVFAEPIYSVAFYESADHKVAPPEPVKRKVIQKKEDPPKPKVEETKPLDMVVKPKVEKKPEPKPKTPPKKDPVKKIETLKPPAKRSDAAIADKVDNTVENLGDVSLGLVDQKDFRHNYYLERIRALLASKWRAPAGKGGVQKATVHFFIERDGRIRGMEIRSGSGASVYDRAAINTVRSVERFPPLPQSYSGNQIGISVVFQTVRGGGE